MGFATFLVHFIIEVPEYVHSYFLNGCKIIWPKLTNRGPARRVWYIRKAPLILTLVMSFFFGSIISEFIQGMLPVSLLIEWKRELMSSGRHSNGVISWYVPFIRKTQPADNQANLTGSTLFLYLAHLLSSRQRRRNELSSVYQPLDSSTYRDARGREHAFGDAQPPREAHRGRAGSNAWDEGSEAGDERREGVSAFQIGDDEEGDRRRVGDLV